MKYVLGVDIGTGSVKAVSLDLNGRPKNVVQRHYAFNSPKMGYEEQDPEAIFDAFLGAVREAIEKAGTAPVAVGLSSAMHSLVPVDSNGKALAPMITWADNRSREIAKRLMSSKAGMDIYKATGTPLHAMSPLCKIIWLRENEPRLFQKTRKFISIKEYIWYHLFTEFKIDYSVASGTGLFNIKKLKWHKKSLAVAGISDELLSTPVPGSYSSINLKKTDLNFLKGITFVIGGSDGCLANLGSMADKPGVAAITIGTSGAVRVASKKPLPDKKTMTFSYILDEHTFICGGPINNGGIAMQWWIKNLKVHATDSDYDKLFEKTATVPPGAEGLIFLPYLTGERAPIWDSDTCGNFFGIGLRHTQAHFSRAVMEGICYALNDVLNALEQNSEQIHQVNISGGFTRADVWVQTLADITGKKLVITQSDDASAVGAGLMALKSFGAIDKYPSHNTEKVKTFSPNNENAKAYATNFAIYKQLYKDLKKTMHRVSEE